MPTVFRQDGFRFFFYSNEGNEPKHIHVEKAGSNGKFWIEPVFAVAYIHGFPISEQKLITGIILENLGLIKQKWNEHFEQ